MDTCFSVLIPDGESVYTLMVLNCFAAFPNVRIHVLSKDRWSPARFSRYCHAFTYKSTQSDNDSFLDAVLDVVRKERIDVLLPVDTSGISFAAANKKILSQYVRIAPLPDPHLIEIANNKWLLSKSLEEIGLPGPATMLVDYDNDFEQEVPNLEFPLLWKPVLSGGGRGITRFDDLTALKKHLSQQEPEKINRRFILQQLISGEDITMNILSSDGHLLASTFQKGLIQTKKYAPMDAVKFIKDDRYLRTAQRLSSSLKWNGWACIDSICDKDGNLRITDINARFWNSLLGSLEAGVSFPYLATQMALGSSLPTPNYDLIRYFHPMTTFREELLSISGKSRESNITFKESGLRFLIADPLAEAIRIYNNRTM